MKKGLTICSIKIIIKEKLRQAQKKEGILMKKHIYITLDTETCGSLGNPLVYDIGYTVHDREGNIYEKRSYVIREIFYGEREKMRTAYYADKLPQYRKGVKSGKWNVASFWSIRKELFSLMKDYKVKAIIAYNAGFDVRALNSTLNYLTKFKEKEQTFFNKNTTIWCSWGMSCQTLLKQKNYFKDAIKHNWISDAGNVQTSAETAFRYINKDSSFEESHTALEDAIIETAIFAKCIKTKKKMDREILTMPWRIPQPEFKEYYKNFMQTA